MCLAARIEAEEISADDFRRWMGNSLVERRQSETVTRRQVREVVVGHLLGRLRMRFQRGQIIGDAFRFALVNEFLEQLPGFVHRHVHHLLVGADAQEAKLAQRTEHDAFALHPSEGFGVPGMVAPDGREQDVHVQQVLKLGQRLLERLLVNRPVQHAHGERPALLQLHFGQLRGNRLQAGQDEGRDVGHLDFEAVAWLCGRQLDSFSFIGGHSHGGIVPCQTLCFKDVLAVSREGPGRPNAQRVQSPFSGSSKKLPARVKDFPPASELRPDLY